ncbi:MAG: hypothetical protein FJX34_03695, partial [Alphaproteobacteria bacterium]|nr:hypothetical protein [Alphaproteobacteria bacterium]
MKINFSSKQGNSAFTALVLTEEETKKSSAKQVKFAKENFGFVGKNNQVVLVSETVLIGAGAREKLDELTLQKIGSRIVSALNGAKIKNAAVVFKSGNVSQAA